MRTFASLLLLACLAAAHVAGQEKKPSVEIGTSLGVTILSQSGASSLTHIGVPGDGIFAQPTVYAAFFPTPSVMIEPQLAFSHLSQGSSSQTAFGGTVQIGYLFTPAERSSPYAAASVGFQSLSDGTSVSGAALGGSLGYRVRVGTGVAVRFEGHYRRWMGDFDGVNEVGFGIGLGGII